MRIAYITAGAAGTICGNCLRDNALAAALLRAGHDVLLLPAYTPIRTDEADVSAGRVVFGGLNMYLQGRYRFLRKSGLFDRLLDHPRLLAWVSQFGVDTQPEKLGAMTLATMQGEEGPHARETGKLIAVLRDFQPDIVHLTNSMFVCLAGPVRRALRLPVVCSLQGEGDFLAHLPQLYRERCFALLRRRAADVNLFIAPCRDQAEALAPRLGVEAEAIPVVMPGIALDGFAPAGGSGGDAFVVGYLARVAEEKGLHLLAEAVARLRAANAGKTIRLRAAGWRGAKEGRYLARAAAITPLEDLGYLERREKIAFLASLDVFSVPAVYRASKGLYMLEALAAGVPAVQPRIGVFPELTARTGGGLLCAPNDAGDLAAKLQLLLDDRARARELGARGRAAVAKDFHAGRTAAETLALYERQLRGKAAL